MLRNKVTPYPLEREVLPALKPLLGDTGQARLLACTALAGVGRELRMYHVRGLGAEWSLSVLSQQVGAPRLTAVIFSEINALASLFVVWA